MEWTPVCVQSACMHAPPRVQAAGPSSAAGHMDCNGNPSHESAPCAHPGPPQSNCPNLASQDNPPQDAADASAHGSCQACIIPMCGRDCHGQMHQRSSKGQQVRPEFSRGDLSGCRALECSISCCAQPSGTRTHSKAVCVCVIYWYKWSAARPLPGRGGCPGRCSFEYACHAYGVMADIDPFVWIFPVLHSTSHGSTVQHWRPHSNPDPESTGKF